MVRGMLNDIENEFGWMFKNKKGDLNDLKVGAAEILSHLIKPSTTVKPHPIPNVESEPPEQVIIEKEVPLPTVANPAQSPVTKPVIKPTLESIVSQPKTAAPYIQFNMKN